MKQVKIALFLLIPFVTGCEVVENSVTDIYSWDLSACVGGGFDVCFELFTDNSDQILGGFNGGLP